MSKKKLVRNKLAVVQGADIHHIAPSNRLEVDVNDGRCIDVSYLRSLDYCELLVWELNIFVRGQRAGRAVANSVLQYLRYVVSLQGAVSPRSLRDYKVVLDERSDIDVNTKSQLFGVARRFLLRLMSAGVLEHSVLVKNFSAREKMAKATFVDVVRYDLPDIMKDRQDEVGRLVGSGLDLSKGEAESLAFCVSCMSALRDFCEERIGEVIGDWEFVGGVVDGLSDEDLVRFRDRGFCDGSEKSIERAISVLYANYGWAIPLDNKAWPAGIYDWVRKKGGWQASRLRAAFFPNVKSLAPFLVLALANPQLCPNVDSVMYYAYLDCCKPSGDRGMVDVYFQKVRGASAAKALSESDPLVLALTALVGLIKARLPAMPGGRDLLRQEYVSCFLHYSFVNVDGERVSRVRSPYPSSPASMVRAVIKGAAEKYSILGSLVGGVTGECFRPTHAYVKKMMGESIYKIKNDLNHSHISTTDSYVDRVEVRAVLNRRQQDYQRYLISEAKSHAKRTGSGYICSSGDSEEESCVELLSCADCEAKRIVWGDERLVAEWIAWEGEISKERGRLVFENPERWVNYWEPRLVEYQTLIGKVSKKTIGAARLLLDGVVVPCLI
jgi:hypothetical protein